MTHRDLDRRRDPVQPSRPSEAGGLNARHPVVESVADVGDCRISRVRRGDGTTFTVTVPPGGMDQPPDLRERTGPWIREDGGGRRAPHAALDRLAARVGMHVVVDHPTGTAED